jgi:hypothetical protein
MTPRINLEQAILSLPNFGQTFRVSNVGTDPLAVNAITQDAPAPWLSFAPAVPFNLPAGAHQDVTVTVNFRQVPAGSATNRLLVTSSDSLNSPYPGGVFVIVNRTNTPPTVSPITDQSTVANTIAGPVPFMVDDAETPAADLTLAATSSDPDLVPVSGIAFAGDGAMRSVTITPTANRSGRCTITVSVSDGAATTQRNFDVTVSAAVAGRFVFYNNSAFDGNDPSANARDDAAVAFDKMPLFAGAIATFANYTSYTRGINGLMIDIAGLPRPPIASDFAFRIGNDNVPSAWAAASDPATITVRQSDGTNRSDRVTLIWADNAVQKQWLEVTVLATTNTGLATSDVFYFGNAIGDSGDTPPGSPYAIVNLVDANAAIIHPRSFLNPAPIDSPYDYNRDQRVNLVDANSAIIHGTSFLNALRLIDLSGLPPGAH